MLFLSMNNQFNAGDTVYYSGSIWVVINVRNNGRLVDLKSVDTGRIIYAVYSTDIT